MFKSLGLTFVISSVVLLLLDAAWLGTTVNILYRPSMAGLMRDDVNLAAGAGFYVIYAFALSAVVIHPAVFRDRVAWSGLVIKSALFGLAAFATYDLTGLAVIRGWSPLLSAIDMGWGTFAAVTASLATAMVLRLTKAAPAR